MTHQHTPAQTQPAPATGRAPLTLYSVRPAPGGGFVVVNDSGLVVSGGWRTENGAAGRAGYLNARENRQRAEGALTGPQRRVYAVARREGAIRSGYRHNLTAVRHLHAAGLVRLTEYGAGSWTAAYVPPPADPAAGTAPAAGTGVAPADAGHPLAAAALAALAGQPLADVTGPGDLGEVAGYWVRPNGDSGRLAVGWAENGKPATGAAGRSPRARLSVAKELFERTAGWLVEAGGDDVLSVWHVPTLETAAERVVAEQDRGAPTDTWTITHSGLPEHRSFLRVEAPDHAAAIEAACATRAGRLVQRAGHRLGARRLREAELERTTGERVRHVTTGQTGTVEAAGVPMTGARSYRDGVTVAIDGRSRKTARALEWEPLPATQDPKTTR
ncbi:hypothetical protein ACFQ8C_24925 [Streptomyces sp. NPDC056503]|uniref:hypothetical protein n=1 Tax=Streptomyces sp. NPDC056503 TaxID=3345842 RepID=UPI003686DD9E